MVGSQLLNRESKDGFTMARPHSPKQTLAVGDSNRQIVWLSDISRRRCYSAMIMLGSDNPGAGSALGARCLIIATAFVRPGV